MIVLLLYIYKESVLMEIKGLKNQFCFFVYILTVFGSMKFLEKNQKKLAIFQGLFSCL